MIVSLRRRYTHTLSLYELVFVISSTTALIRGLSLMLDVGTGYI